MAPLCMPAAPATPLPAAWEALLVVAVELMPAVEPPVLTGGLTAAAPAGVATAPAAWPAVMPGAMTFVLMLVAGLPAAEPCDRALSACDAEPHAAHTIINPVAR